MRRSIGIFGNGRWSKIIQTKLANMGPGMVDVKFVADSKSDYISHLDEFELDWAIVASTTGSHYEIVESCLQEGVSVFCEKPLASNPKEVQELYALAKTKNVELYVDDVFMWRNDIATYIKGSPKATMDVKAVWTQAANIKNPKLCLDDFLYHHLYIIGELLHFPKNIMKKVVIRGDQMYVTLKTIGGQTFSMKYGLNDTKAKHVFSSLSLNDKPNDALEDMLLAVFIGRANSKDNKRRTMWATKTLYEIKKQLMPSIGVIGAGIFGGTIAILLANEGCKVTVYEKGSDVLLGASAKNQLRIHRGYHYPRSKETSLSSKLSEYKFRSYYRAAMDNNSRHLYAIAKLGSLTTTPKFENFMKDINLDYKKLDKNYDSYSLFKKDSVVAAYEVPESSYDPVILRRLIKLKLNNAEVDVRLNHKVEPKKLLRDHDYVISATYSEPLTTNQEYQFEVCEKPLVRLSDQFKNTSILILDGPFIGIDPLPNTPYHLLDSVSDAIHSTNIGFKAEVPDYIEKYINKGLIKKPINSRYELFIKTGQRFYKDFHPVEYLGSYFVVRAVLPYREHDDARPTIFRQVHDNYYDVISGKVGTAPSLGQQIVKELLYPER